MPNKVYITSTKEFSSATCVKDALNWLNASDQIRSDSRVFIKPNFTYPFYKEGVTTSPAMIEALVQALRDYTSHIMVGESNGGVDCWTAEETFRGHNLEGLVSKYGVRLVNLSSIPSEKTCTEIDGKLECVVLPSLLLHETDIFITMPVPKVHAMTGVTLGFKNQWGCQPDVKRLRDHYRFSRAILAINKLLDPKFAVYDGTFFLDRFGPIDGDPVRMDLLIAANAVGAGDLASCRIMNIDPKQIEHLQLAAQNGLMPSSLETVEFNQSILPFCTRSFRLQQSLRTRVTRMVFRNRFATQFFYDSRFAKAMHRIWYAIVGAPKDFAPHY